MQHSEEKIYKPYGTLKSGCKTKGTLCRPQLQGGNNILQWQPSGQTEGYIYIVNASARHNDQRNTVGLQISSLVCSNYLLIGWLISLYVSRNKWRFQVAFQQKRQEVFSVLRQKKSNTPKKKHH